MPSASYPNHPSIDEVQNWAVFVEYQWVDQASPFDNYSIPMRHVLGYIWGLFQRVHFIHASLYILSKHPKRKRSVGAVWELGTADQTDNKGTEIQILTSYYAHRQVPTDQIPAGWSNRFADESTEYWHGKENERRRRVYKKIGKVLASMAEIDDSRKFESSSPDFLSCFCLARAVKGTSNAWSGAKYHMLLKNCELFVKTLLEQLERDGILLVEDGFLGKIVEFIMTALTFLWFIKFAPHVIAYVLPGRHTTDSPIASPIVGVIIPIILAVIFSYNPLMPTYINQQRFVDRSPAHRILYLVSCFYWPIRAF